MPLPKSPSPMFDVIIPSTNKKTKMRPMLVKEEKILLIAKEAKDDGDILNAIKQIVNNCLVDESIDINKMSIIDLEYLFIKLRSISISNISTVVYIDNEDQKTYKFDIDLNKVKVVFSEKIEKTIKLSDTSGILLKYPDASMYSDKLFLGKSESELFEAMILNCIEKIYEDDKIFIPAEYTRDEMVDFLENMDINTFNKFREFTSNLPKIEYVIEYKNSLNNDRKIILSSLNDFFTLG